MSRPDTGALMSPAGGGARGRQRRLAAVTIRVAVGCLGAAMIVLPAPELTGRAGALLPAGLVLVAASLAGPRSSNPLSCARASPCWPPRAC